MTYSVPHVFLVKSDVEVVNTEKSEVMIRKMFRLHTKLHSCLGTCAVWHIFDKEEYKVYLHLHLGVRTVYAVFLCCKDLQ